MRAIIIEDTPAHLATLETLLRDHHPEVEIIGTADSVVKGIQLIQSHPQALAFLDVELPDGTAFDLLEQLDIPTPRLIFTTANLEYAIQAFRWAAMDYLLKPIRREELYNALNRVQGRRQLEDQIQLIQQVRQKQKNRLAVATQEAIHMLEVKDILHIQASGNYSTIYLDGSKKLLVTKTLKEFETMLSSSGFVRVHQSHLVSLDHIVSYVKTDGGYLVLHDNSKIPVASRRRSAVIQMLTDLL